MIIIEKTFKSRISNRYDTHEAWSSNNPILKQGEIAVVVYEDRVCMKVGDGASAYNDLCFSSAFSVDSTPITTEGDGVEYIATVPWITELKAGVSFIMIPHVVSASTSPTLKVNNFESKRILRKTTAVATGSQPGASVGWLLANYPFRLIYDGVCWVVEGQSKPVATDILGTVAAATADGAGRVITDTYITRDEMRELEQKIPTDYVTAQALQEVEDKIPTHNWENLEGKPFYEEENEVYDYSVEQSEYDVSSYYEGTPNKRLIAGEVYTVLYNGQEYECTAYGNVYASFVGDTVYIGNPSLIDADSAYLYDNEFASLLQNDTGEPFCIYTGTFESSNIVRIFSSSKGVAEVFAVYQTETSTTLVPLDSKFIGPDIARVTDIHESFSGKWEDLEGRPFGEEVELTTIFDKTFVYGGNYMSEAYEISILPNKGDTIKYTYTVNVGTENETTIVGESVVYKPYDLAMDIGTVGQVSFFSSYEIQLCDDYKGQTGYAGTNQTYIKLELKNSTITPLSPKFLPPEVVTEEELGEKVDKAELDKYYLKSEADTLHTEVLEYVDTEVAALVSAAPETLDTLGELATAFEENQDMVQTLNEAITYKADKTDVQALQSQVLLDSLVVADAITGDLYKIQIRNGQLVSFAVSEEV